MLRLVSSCRGLVFAVSVPLIMVNVYVLYGRSPSPLGVHLDLHDSGSLATEGNCSERLRPVRAHHQWRSTMEGPNRLSEDSLERAFKRNITFRLTSPRSWNMARMPFSSMKLGTSKERNTNDEWTV